jgi:hypothetical protein
LPVMMTRLMLVAATVVAPFGGERLAFGSCGRV